MRRTKTRSSTALFVLGACWLAAACGGSLRPAYPIQTAADVLARQAATSEGLHAIRAEARVDQRQSSGRVRGTVLMFVEQSGRVRFDVISQFGPIAILTSDGAQFAFSDFREHRFLTGATCPQNIARLLGVQLTAEETARFLLGGTPLLQGAASLELDDEGHYRVELTSEAGGRQRLELAVYPSDLQLPALQQRLYLVHSELWSQAGARVWRVSYDDYASIPLNEPGAGAAKTLLVPMRVHIEQAGNGSDTLVHFKKIVSNPPIPDAVFVQSPRPGLSEESADCE